MSATVNPARKRRSIDTGTKRHLVRVQVDAATPRASGRAVGPLRRGGRDDRARSDQRRYAGRHRTVAPRRTGQRTRPRCHAMTVQISLDGCQTWVTPHLSSASAAIMADGLEALDHPLGDRSPSSRRWAIRMTCSARTGCGPSGDTGGDIERPPEADV